MTHEERSYDPISIKDLERLRELALEEHENFFVRNLHLRKAYYNSLIGICLCQGAASHYLSPTVGVKDFDIWFFYLENEKVKFPYRAHKRLENGYKEKPIDFLKRAIPKDIYDLYFDSSERIIVNYLFKRNTTTKILLLNKPIIGLYPSEIFNKILWKGKL